MGLRGIFRVFQNLKLALRQTRFPPRAPTFPSPDDKMRDYGGCLSKLEIHKGCSQRRSWAGLNPQRLKLSFPGRREGEIMIKLELHRHWLELQSQAGFLLLEPAHAVNMWLVGHIWEWGRPWARCQETWASKRPWPPMC